MNHTNPVAAIDAQSEAQARQHQDNLTKPIGALGRLEEIACWFAARQGRALPEPLRPAIAVFAADHGVCAAGVSAFPSVVTAEMVKNFAHGGAAINVLAEQIGARLSVVDVGVAADLALLNGVAHHKVSQGTANLLHTDAMDAAQCEAAMMVGRAQADEAIAAGANLLIAGDMGIGNTTASACLICRLAQAAPEAVVGRGTGVDDAGYVRKLAVVQQALARVVKADDAALLQQVGGLEIAAMAGFYLQAAQRGVPMLIDGFIASAAALAARSFAPDVGRWMLASHVSAESGHALALAHLQLKPFIDFNMRLGEGSGAALVVPLLQSAIALHGKMATFASANVSKQ